MSEVHCPGNGLSVQETKKEFVPQCPFPVHSRLCGKWCECLTGMRFANRLIRLPGIARQRIMEESDSFSLHCKTVP